jgi:hypothetical protein
MKLTSFPFCSRDADILEFVIDHIRPPPVSIKLHALTLPCMLGCPWEVGDFFLILLVLLACPGWAYSHRR